MKKLIISILTLFLFTSAYAEESMIPDKTNQILAEQLTFKNTLAYQNGMPYTGRVAEYQGDKIFIEYSYKNGIQEGLEIEWHTGTSEKEHESHWIAGKKEGIYTEYWPDGSKKSTVNYKNDVKEGLKTVWSKSGDIDYQQNYSGGTRLGKEFIPTLTKVATALSPSLKPSTINLAPTPAPIKFKKLSKQDIFETFSDKVIVFNVVFRDYQDGVKYPVCIEVSPGSAKAIEAGEYRSINNNLVNCNQVYVKDVWAEYMSGKLCIETQEQAQTCKVIREFSNEKYKFGFSPITVHSELSPTFKPKYVYDENDSPLEDGSIIFIESPIRPQEKLNWNNEHLAKYKELLQNPPPLSDLPKNIFATHPYLEWEYEDMWEDTIKVCRIELKQCIPQLRLFAAAGMESAYIALLFSQADITKLIDSNPFPYQSPVFRNLFNFATDVENIKIPELTPIAIYKNSNNLTDQRHLFREFIILSQEKFQHYNWVLENGGDYSLPLAYKTFAELGQTNEMAQYYIVARTKKDTLKPIREYLISDDEIVQSLVKQANADDILSVFVLMNAHSPSPLNPYNTHQILTSHSKKAIFYAERLLELASDRESMMRNLAYKILDELHARDSNGFKIHVPKPTIKNWN